MKKNLVVTLILIGLFVVGEIFVSNKLTDNKVKDFDLTKAKELVDKFYTDDYVVTSNIFKDGMTERYKISMAMNSIKDKLKETDCSELYKDKKKDSDGIVVGDGTFCDGKANTISYTDLETAYKSLFGNKAKLAKKTIGVFNYIEDKNIFVYLSCRCGGVDNSKYIYKVKDAKIKGNTLTINVYYHQEEKPAKDFDEAKYLEENLDKMDIYTMTLKKENKVFKLLEVKKVS